jgi:putative heme degradation protein
LTGWGSAFSIVEESHGSLRRNIQFLDKAGDALVKIVVWSKNANDTFDQLVERFQDPAPLPLAIKSAADEGWLSLDEPDEGAKILESLSAKLQMLFKVCVDEKVKIELRVPTRASAETYRGPIQIVEPRDEEGNWIDLRYPHFTSHFFIGQVSHGIVSDDKSIGHVLTIVDKDNRIACIVNLPKGDNAALDEAWSNMIA